MNRVDKTNYYLDIAESVASRSTCLRKKYGTVIVKNDEIISTGYSGSPRGRANCIDLGYCNKKKVFPDAHHTGYDACRGVHSEQNAIISASRKDMMNSTLYLVGYKETENGNEYEEGASPCLTCRKFIINSGIEKVVVREDKKNYIVIDVEEWVKNDELLNDVLAY
ncbi:MAG: cytidine deaminase [Lachnospiraceae bacterium]|jgi:dCMP deaminase|nr:cytidine deaminase [Lachnospiraceae bacterium]